MTDKRIDQLTNAPSEEATDWIHTNKAGVDYRTPLSKVSAFQITTLDLISSSTAYAADTSITTNGYTTSGDGGSGAWVQNGVTGQTASQTPTQLGGALLNDANGNQWSIVSSVALRPEQLGAIEDNTTDNTSLVTIAISDQLLSGRAALISANTFYSDSIGNSTPANGYLNGAFGKIQYGYRDSSKRATDGSPALVIEKHSKYDSSATDVQDNGFVVSVSKSDTVSGSGARGIYGYVDQASGTGGSIGIHGRARTTSADSRIWGMWAYADRGGVALNRTIGFESNVKSNIDSPYDTSAVGGGVDGIISATVDSTGICNNAYRVTKSSGAGWRTGFQVPINSINPASASDEGEICKYGGSSLSANKYGGIRFYDGFFDYAMKTNEATFDSDVAIQLKRDQRITWAENRSSSTYITYTDSTDTMDITGNAVDFKMSSTSPIKLNGVKILSARKTGFGTVTDATSKASWSTNTVTLDELAERVGAIWDALRDHGLIGN
tara:strand:+ start:3177 stop:4661 length:1485 start_codon:yes stop_codon:yes gene_type:complete